jgi:hypothetical protein
MSMETQIINVVVEKGKINNIYYPHFTAYFNGGCAKISLDRKMTEGELPPESTHMIMDWARRNYDVLEKKWVNIIGSTQIK